MNQPGYIPEEHLGDSLHLGDKLGAKDIPEEHLGDSLPPGDNLGAKDIPGDHLGDSSSPGSDGKFRVISVKYPNGKIKKRPIVKISSLPIQKD